MDLHSKLSTEIHAARMRVMFVSLIMMHPDTLEVLLSKPEFTKKRGTEKGGYTYQGIAVYRSEDMELNKFIVK